MIISVASGKGGTGKTTVATGLALALRDNGFHVAYLDCDVEEPNGHIFLKPEFTESEEIYLEVPVIDDQKCNLCGKCAELCAFNAILAGMESVITFPELCHGCGGCSFFCPAGAISPGRKKIGVVDRGHFGRALFARGQLEVGTALSPPLVKAVKNKAVAGDIVVVDCPPGTSCPALAAVKGSDFCLLVTEPTPFGLHDLDLAVKMNGILGVPCGVIINRAGNGRGLIEDYCARSGLPLLMKIPLSRKVAESGSRGVPLNCSEAGWDEMFIRLFHAVRRMVDGERAYSSQR